MDGWRDDDLAFTLPWGFDLASITVPVSIWQGSEDLMVPQQHAPWLAAAIQGAELHIAPGEGHISLAMRSFDLVLDWIVERGGLRAGQPA